MCDQKNLIKTKGKVCDTYVFWANGDSLVALQHTRDDYCHLSGALQAQHIWFLQHRRRL